MAIVVAIGGGATKNAVFTTNTLPLDKQIIELSGKQAPRVLFVPTAHRDGLYYSRSFYEYYGRYMGCDVEVLSLSIQPSQTEMKHAVDRADVIYVGGGDTFRMMKIWHKTGFDKILLEASKTNKVLAGVSAGAICWFEAGISDSRRYTRHGRKWPYINVHGLNVVRGLKLHEFILCPHYDTEPRRHTSLSRILKGTSKIGIALEETTALIIKDDKYRIISTDNNHKAYAFFWKDSHYHKEILDKGTNWKHLASLNNLNAKVEA